MERSNASSRVERKKTPESNVKVPYSSQIHLQLIQKNPKKFEDITMNKGYVASTNQLRLGNLNDGLAVANNPLHGDVPSENGLSKSIVGSDNRNISSSSGHMSKIVTHISKGLQERLNNFPEYNSAPFFIIPKAPIYPTQKGTFVKLPINLENCKDSSSWIIVEKNLVNLNVQCTNGNIKNIPNAISSTIKSYCSDSGQRSNFKMLDRTDLVPNLASTIPTIIGEALQLPVILDRNIPMLLSGENKIIYLTRRLCSSLLANAFFCTFPEPTSSKVPDFNFFRLFNDTQTKFCEVKKEKIKCILNYFTLIGRSRSNQNFLDQIISFERRCDTKRVDWARETANFCQVKVDLQGKIEHANNMLQVDFANKMVGGGVLNDGSVMEEIRFCISPELIVARLFTEMLNDHEVLVVTGTEIFSQYTGYSTTFAFKDKAVIKFGKQPIDTLGRTFTQVVTMDACSFKRNESKNQFQQQFIDRELHKAKVAFKCGMSHVTPVATGNWGCGAFNGNAELKFLLQWIAASHQCRPNLSYYTVGDQQQAQAIMSVISFVAENKFNVGNIYNILLKFSTEPGYENASLFNYVKSYSKSSKVGKISISK